MKKFPFHTTSLILACSLGCGVMTSCGDDEPEDTDKRLYQEYEVQVVEQSTIAFANLRIGNANGKRVKLSGASSLEANGHEMSYMTPVSDTNPPFTYMAIVNIDATTVTFSLNVDSSHSLVNSVNLNHVPDVKPEIEDGILGNTFNLDLNGAEPYEVSVNLTNPLGTGETLYSGGVAANGTVIFSETPAPGRYKLNVTCSRTFRTQQNDGNASGSIRLSKIHSQVVTVKK